LNTIDHPGASPALPMAEEQRLPPMRAAAVRKENGAAVARRLLILVALYATPAAALVCPLSSSDLWWHLRTGQWIAQHGTVPRTDPFSVHGQGRPWVAYSWLFEVTTYGLYQALGLTGIVLYRLAVCAAVLLSVHRLVARREPHFVRAAVLTALAFLALVPLLSERSWLFTILFTTCTLSAVLSLRAGTATRAVWLLPVAFALWANLHIQFVYGLAVLGLACLAPLADALLGRPVSGTAADTPGTRPWWRLLGLTAACAAATLVNPYGPRLYAVVAEFASQTAVTFNVVDELKAPSFRMPADWVFLALAGAGAFALGRRARGSLFELLLLAGTALLAFRAGRDTWFLVLASLTALTADPRPAAAAERFPLSGARVAVVAAAVALFLTLVACYRDLSEQRLADAVARSYPVAAVEYVRQAGYPGPLFTDVEWGGYLTWALPERLVNIDGRAELHGEERLARHTNTVQGVGWEDDPELTRARLVVTVKVRGLSSVLRLSPRFEKVYEDRVAVVFKAR
jgi:hypothetical protein